MDVATKEPNADVKGFRNDLKPIWCPGCGDFGVLGALTKALDALGRLTYDTAVISGSGGCQLNTPAGCPSTTGVSGPHMPRRNRYITPPRCVPGAYPASRHRRNLCSTTLYSSACSG